MGYAHCYALCWGTRSCGLFRRLVLVILGDCTRSGGSISQSVYSTGNPKLSALNSSQHTFRSLDDDIFLCTS